MSVIDIDGESYEVGEVSLSREFELVVDSTTSGKMLDESLVEDIVATNMVYSVVVEPRSGKHRDYDAFIHDITSPKSRRLVTLPYGQETVTFEANVVSAGDTLLRAYKYNKWGGLSITFKPLRPQRYASGAEPDWKMFWKKKELVPITSKEIIEIVEGGGGD